MKRPIIGIIIALIVFVMAGCSAIQVQPAENLALQIAAQRVGYYVAKNNPSIVSQATLVAQGVTATKESDAIKVAMNLAIAELVKQFPDDPLLESDLKLIASGIKLDIPAAKIDTSQLEPIIAAFINGMKVGGVK